MATVLFKDLIAIAILLNSSHEFIKVENNCAYTHVTHVYFISLYAVDSKHSDATLLGCIIIPYSLIILRENIFANFVYLYP